jgi:hypothetical protein
MLQQLREIAPVVEHGGLWMPPELMVAEQIAYAL